MDNYTLHRGRLIDHIQLVVNDFAASKAFYTAVLAELKIPMVITDDDYICHFVSKKFGVWRSAYRTAPSGLSGRRP